MFATSRALGTALGRMDAEIDAKRRRRQENAKADAASRENNPQVASVRHQTDASGFKVPNPPSSASTSADGSDDKAPSTSSVSSPSPSSSSSSSLPSETPSMTSKNGEPTTSKAAGTSEQKSEAKSDEVKSNGIAVDKEKANGVKSSVAGQGASLSSVPPASNASAPAKPKAPKPKPPPPVSEELVREWQEFASDAYIVAKLRAIEQEKTKKVRDGLRSACCVMLSEANAPARLVVMILNPVAKLF